MYYCGLKIHPRLYTLHSLLASEIVSLCVTVFPIDAGRDSSTLVEIIGGVFGAVGFLAIVVIIIVVIWKLRCAYINK